jgi:hypothetical protein
VVETLEEYLRERPGGVSAEEIAAEVLRLSGPAALTLGLAEKALAAVPGAIRGADGLWRMDDEPERFTLGAVVAATGPDPDVDRILGIGIATVDGEVILSLSGDPDHPVPLSELRPAMRRARAYLEDARFVFFETYRLAAHLGDGPKETVVLRRALRRAERIGPRAGLAKAASEFGVTVPESEEPGDLAATVAALFAAALEEGIDAAAPPPTPDAFDFDRVDFGPELLDEIPDRPGVYRFLDTDGEVLYVGKAKDLRGRVASYFAPKSKRRKKHAELMERLASIEWEETGSELSALLTEQREIRRHEPPINVQREVRHRRDADGDYVLFLPGEPEGVIDLLLVRGGEPVGRATSDARARGMREVRAALRRAFFSPEPPPPGSDDDAQIVASWLHAAADRQNFLDVSTVRGPSEAARLVKACLTDPELFTRKIFRR